MNQREEGTLAVKWNKLQWRLGRRAPPNMPPNRHESAPHLSICRRCYSTGYDRDDTKGVTTWCSKCLGTGYVVNPGQEPPPDDLPKWHWFYQIGMIDSGNKNKKGYALMREIGTPKMYLKPDFGIHRVSEVRLKKDDTDLLKAIEELTQIGKVDKKGERKRSNLLALQKFGMSCTALEEGKYSKLAEDRASEVEHRIGRTRGDRYSILKFSKPAERFRPSNDEKFSKLAAVMDRSHGIEQKKPVEKMDSLPDKKKLSKGAEDVCSSSERKKISKLADEEYRSLEENKSAEELGSSLKEKKFGKVAEEVCNSPEKGQLSEEVRSSPENQQKIGQLEEKKLSILKLSKVAEDVWKSCEIEKFSKLTENAFSSLEEKFSKMVEKADGKSCEDINSFLEETFGKPSEEVNGSFEENLIEPSEAISTFFEVKLSQLATDAASNELDEEVYPSSEEEKFSELAEEMGTCPDVRKIRENNSMLKVKKLAKEKENPSKKQKIGVKELREEIGFLWLYRAVHSSAESDSSGELESVLENDVVEDDEKCIELVEQVNEKRILNQ